MIFEEKVKRWCVLHAKITYPNKQYWCACTTLGGLDINGMGETIEEAYKALTMLIICSPHFSNALVGLPTWKAIKQL